MKIKENLFPPSLFAIYLGVLLLMSGIHTGLIVFMNRVHLNELAQVIIPMVYWGIVAVGLTLFTRQKMKSTYEEPLHKMAEATGKVSKGDFSVYVPTIHTTDKLDYLDVMILDFNKMVEELGSIETLKTDFVSNVSHEMKTPIAIIKNYAELLLADRIEDEKRKEYARSVENAATRLSELISNILKLNKLENQKIMPAMVRADASLMELVWNNLISNAIKFTEPGGSVRVSQTSNTDCIRIVVSDTGCGMSRESIDHIFDKFYQGDTSHAKEGNGLGLALVKRVLELMDGDIQVVSEEGKHVHGHAAVSRVEKYKEVIGDGWYRQTTENLCGI